MHLSFFQSKGQALTLDHMSTPAPLDVKGHTQGHAADQSVHKGHTDITNIENQESTAATKSKYESGEVVWYSNIVLNTKFAL